MEIPGMWTRSLSGFVEISISPRVAETNNIGVRGSAFDHVSYERAAHAHRDVHTRRAIKRPRAKTQYYRVEDGGVGPP